MSRLQSSNDDHQPADLSGLLLTDSAEDGNLNISPSMFSQFYNLDQGVFQGDYKFD